MLTSLGHVTVRSADFERTERFYCDLLGMRVGPRPAIPLPGRWFYVGDEAVVHVLPRTVEGANEQRFAGRFRRAAQPLANALADVHVENLV